MSGNSGNRDRKLQNDARSVTQTGNASGNSTNANQRQGGLAGQKSGGLPQPQVKSILCFICQSPSHKQANCPLRVNTAGKSGQGHGTARNYTCANEPRTDIVTGTEGRGLKNQALSTGGSYNDGHALQAIHVTMRPTVENQRSTDRERQASHGRVTNSNLASEVKIGRAHV